MQPLRLARAVLDDRLSVTSHFAQLANLFGRNEAGTDEPIRDQLGNPSRVSDVRLAPRDVVQVLRIEQPTFEFGLE